MLNERQREFCAAVQNFGKQQGLSLYVVGGIVRDLLLGYDLDRKDIDILVEGDALSFARQVQAEVGGTLKLYPEFLTAKLVCIDRFPELHEVDFASSRSERYGASGALPEVAAATLSKDLSRRDFSINAIALPLRDLHGDDREYPDRVSLKKKCIDPFHGIADLELRQIRVLHQLSFWDDPTRLFRAIRYQYRLKGILESSTGALYQEAITTDLVSRISARRQVNEIIKIFLEEDPVLMIDAAESTGLLGTCFQTFALPERRADFYDLVSSLAKIPFLVRSNSRPAIERALVICLMNLAGEARRSDLYQQLSISRQLRATLEQDMDMADSSDQEHVYSAAGFMYLAIRQPCLRAWALKQLESREP